MPAGTPEVAFLLDAPTALPETAEDAPVVSERPIARLGSYKDPRYGKFAITAKDVASWQRNLAAQQDGRLAIDYDHAADRAGGSTKAAGWITALRLDGPDVLATIEWTPEGAAAVRDRYWLYVSPSFTSRYTDEQDRDQGPALLGVALTNRPFLRKGMPAISLSRELEQVAFAEPEVFPDIPDAMPELTKIAEALSLSEDATEDQIVTAIQDLGSKFEDAEKSADKLRESVQGKVLLDEGQVSELQGDAKAGREAREELREQRFTLTFTKALDEGRVDAKPETRERYHNLYEKAEDDTIALIADLPKIVNTEAHGKTGSIEDVQVPAGFDADSFELDRKVQLRLEEHPDEDYAKALSIIREQDKVAA